MEISLFAGLAGLFILLAVLVFTLLARRRQAKRRPPAGKTADKALEPEPGETDRLLHSYFRGLSYVLSNDTDRAVAEFIKVAQVNSATSEIYLALGQLFRKTGEIERAIRIHRNLLLRSSLPANIRLQTIFEIGLDYKQAGLIDRARQTFEELLDEAPTFVEALTELGSIYELCREWDKAIEVQKKLAALGDHESEHVLAHLTTEMAKEYELAGDWQRALKLYRRAIEIDPGCIDAWLHLGDLQLQQGQTTEAVAAWERGFAINPDLASLTVSRLAALPADQARASQEKFFQTNLQAYGGNVNFIAAYINFLIDEGKYAEAAGRIKEMLVRRPDCAALFQLTGRLVHVAAGHPECRDLLPLFFSRFQPVDKPYQCGNCGCYLEEVV